MDNSFLAQLEKDRANLVENLQRMQAQYEDLGRRLQQQAGACQYVDLLIARVKEERNGVTGAQESGDATPL